MQNQLWMNITLPWFLSAITVAVGAIVANDLGFIDYHLSLKFLRYDHLLLDLIIPISFIVMIIGFFQRITKIMPLHWLVKLEKHSITIMYLHLFTDTIMNDFFQYEIIGFTVLGLVIPIIISMAMHKFIPHGKFLLGDIRAKKPI